jgi:hypothetical protein
MQLTPCWAYSSTPKIDTAHFLQIVDWKSVYFSHCSKTNTRFGNNLGQLTLNSLHYLWRYTGVRKAPGHMRPWIFGKIQTTVKREKMSQMMCYQSHVLEFFPLRNYHSGITLFLYVSRKNLWLSGKRRCVLQSGGSSSVGERYNMKHTNRFLPVGSFDICVVQ